MVSYKELGLVNTKEMFAKAIKGGYAIPAFNFNNMIDFSIGHGSAFPCHMHIYGGRHGERDVRAPALSDSRSCGRSSRFLSACLASPRVRIQ